MKNFYFKRTMTLLFVLCFILIAKSSFATARLELTMGNPGNVTATSFEFDIYIRNSSTAGETINLRAGSPQVYQTGTAIPVSPIPAYTLIMAGPEYVLNTPTLSYSASTFRYAQSPVAFPGGGVVPITVPNLFARVKILSNAGNITYPVTLAFRTSTPNITLSAFVNGVNTNVTFSLANGNLDLGANMEVSAPLPVELAEFAVAPKEEANHINWSTASELNSQYHIVERSANGIENWQEIGRKNAAGTTYEEQRYHLSDEHPLPMSYYRLKMVDFDGKYEYSKVVSVERNYQDFAVTNVFPVPTAKEVTLQLTLQEAASLTITVTDLFGRTVSVNSIDSEKGVSNIIVDLANLAVGTYFVTIANGVAKLTERIVKQ